MDQESLTQIQQMSALQLKPFELKLPIPNVTPVFSPKDFDTNSSWLPNGSRCISTGVMPMIEPIWMSYSRKPAPSSRSSSSSCYPIGHS
jgi:hypothetical protein